MKYVKTLGLAAVAAAALMAFIGASSASATVLCKTTPAGTPTGCSAGQAWPDGTEVHAVNVGTVFLHSSFKTVECKKSTIKGKTENEGSDTETVRGPVESLTFEECNCEVKVLTANGLGTIEVHSLANHNGTLTANGQEVTVTCSTVFGNVHCIYITQNKDLGEITHSETDVGGTVTPAIFHAEATIERKVTNALCAEESTWTATYQLTSPSPLYIASQTGA